MKLVQRITFFILSILFAISPLAINMQPVGANSYFGGNGRIIFYSPVDLDDSTQEIYSVKPDGTDIQRLTNNAFADANPQWAPSGDKIAFDRHMLTGSNQQDIYVMSMNTNGTANGSATVLAGANTTEREFDPSWKPDGSQIAYHRRGTVGGSGPYQIFVIPSTGGSPIRVTNDDADSSHYHDTEPTWRKDGNYLAFKHTLVGGSAAQVAISTPSSGATPVVIDTESAGIIGSPQWSPVKNELVYTKNGNLWIYNQDTAVATKLADGSFSAPTWSPDGKLIATSISGQITYVSAQDGSIVATKPIAAGPTQTVEVDWARATAPENTEHECTTYVNEDCTEFTPGIPEQCQTITTTAAYGTPRHEDGSFRYTPDEGYVGDDTYVYEYHDENMNSITCTVHITVLPHPPDSGRIDKLRPLLYSALGLMGIGTILGIKRKFRTTK